MQQMEEEDWTDADEEDVQDAADDLDADEIDDDEVSEEAAAAAAAQRATDGKGKQRKKMPAQRGMLPLLRWPDFWTTMQAKSQILSAL